MASKIGLLVLHPRVAHAGGIAFDPDEVAYRLEPDFLPDGQEPVRLPASVEAHAVGVGLQDSVEFGEGGEYPTAVVVVGYLPAAAVGVADK